jgi:predicted transglutaminase-like cysteine proteinase
MAALVLAAFLPIATAFSADLFGYREERQTDLAAFPEWLSALDRHLRDDLREGDCSERLFNRCHMAEWQRLLARLRGQPWAMQLMEINRYANEKAYVLDLENYGREDYWAIPRQFLGAGGDCEDYAITKYFSLTLLGYARDDLRIVVVQDTNLRVPHAVLAVRQGERSLILDNQVRDVLPDRAVVHYAPVLSLNERSWWIHTPR